MHRGHYHNKSHENVQPRIPQTKNAFGSSNRIKDNSAKFLSKNIAIPNIEKEISTAIAKNKDVTMVSHEENKIVISMQHDGKKYLIEIVYPRSYPESKKGFSCSEIKIPGIPTLSFIQKADKQFKDKILSIDRVISHIANTFNKYKEKTKSENEPVDGINIPNTQIVFSTSAMESDDWNVIDIEPRSPSTHPGDGVLTNKFTTPDTTRGVLSNEFTTPDTTRRVLSKEFTTPDTTRGVLSKEFTTPDTTRGVLSKEFTTPDTTRRVLSKEFITPDTTRGVLSKEFTAPDTTRGVLSEEFTTPDAKNNEGTNIEMVNLDPEFHENSTLIDNCQNITSASDIDLINKILEASNECNSKTESVVEDIYTSESNTEQSSNDDEKEQITAKERLEPTYSFDSEMKNNDVSSKSNEEDNCQVKDDVFDDDDDDDICILKKDTHVQVQNKVIPEPNAEITFDTFVEQNIKLLEKKNPYIEEDKMMDIIQKNWNKYQKELTKTGVQNFMEEDDDIDEKEPAVVKKATTNASDESDDDISLNEVIYNDGASSDHHSQEEMIREIKSHNEFMRETIDYFENINNSEYLSDTDVVTNIIGEENDKKSKSKKIVSDDESDEDITIADPDDDDDIVVVSENDEKSTKDDEDDDENENDDDEDDNNNKKSTKVDKDKDEEDENEDEEQEEEQENEEEDDEDNKKSTKLDDEEDEDDNKSTKKSKFDDDDEEEQDEEQENEEEDDEDNEENEDDEENEDAYKAPAKGKSKKEEDDDDEENEDDGIKVAKEDDEEQEDDEENEDAYKAPAKGKSKANAKTTSVSNELLMGEEKNTTSLSTIKRKREDTNEVSFADVDDPMGLYLDLADYTKSNKMPFDEEKLLENAKKVQGEMEFGNTNKVNKSFSSNSAIRVVYNEFKRVYNMGLRNNFTISPIDNNIYNLMITFNKEFFDKTSKIYQDITQFNKSVIINVKIDGKLYPFYPPKIKLMSPRLKNHMNCRIATMECLLLSNWNPEFSLETILKYFKDLMNLHGEIDTSSSSDNYDELENDLIELSLLSEIPARINSFLTIDELKNIKQNSQDFGSPDSEKNKNGKYWTSGVGYGHSGLAVWDVNSSLKIKEERDKQLAKSIKNITKRITKIITSNIDINVVEIVINSCFIPYMKSIFYGNTILELLKNPTHFDSLLNSMRIMNNKFVPIFMVKDGENQKSLHEIFSHISMDCQMYLKTMAKSSDENVRPNNESKIEMDLVSNFVSFYKRIDKQINLTKENEESKQKLLESNLSAEQIYKNEMMNERCQNFEEMNFTAFQKLIKEAGETDETQFSSGKSSHRVATEIISLSKDLPIEFGSSIFYRYNDNNLRFHEFIIAGPAGTPYDSGCFHFRLYCPKNYPNSNPKVNIFTTGNGRVKFNPNLYSEGKICLSLLGTFHGDKSESWIPGESTMLQIMVSIQSIIMNDYPYFNEAGYEKYQVNEKGMTDAKNYNYQTRLHCMKWAMIDIIKNPTKGFENAIRTHFKLKAEYIKETCSKWMDEAPASQAMDYKNTFRILCKELDKLTGKTTNMSKFENKPPVRKTSKKVMNRTSKVIPI